MSSSRVSIDQMAEAINKGLQEYADLTASELKKAVRKTANETKNEVQANAPVRTGAYKKSWTTKKISETSETIEMKVYSKNHYQLAHLLEFGHIKRGGGRVEGIPHIAPAEANVDDKLKKHIEEALR